MVDLVPVEHDPFTDVSAPSTFSASGLFDAFRRGQESYTRQVPDVMTLKNLSQTWQNTPGLDVVQGFPVEHDPFTDVSAPSTFSASGLFDAFRRGQESYTRQVPDVMTLKNLSQTWQNTPGLDVVQGLGPGGVGLAGSIKAVVPAVEREVAAVAPAVAQEAAPGIRAYHGSPHDFDAFDISKIGTGEGAQAYGHGLYFAENEGTALSYKNAPRVTDADWPVSGTDYKLPSWVAKTAKTPQGLEEVRNNFVGRLEESKRELEAGDWNAQGRIYNQQRIIDALDAVKSGAEMKQPGKMYEVNIAAHPDQFLDWDKPLSEQHPQVRQAFAKVLPPDVKTRDIGINPQIGESLHDVMVNHGTGYGSIGTFPQSRLSEVLADPYKFDPRTGATLYNSVKFKTPPAGYDAHGNALYDAMTALNSRDPANATDALRQAGIPGIKYLDQGSRGSGTGTKNYVVFDDNLISIIKKYGIAALGAFPVGSHFLVPVDHDPFDQGATP